jgi:cytochrome c-type biogenesis protein CcmH
VTTARFGERGAGWILAAFLAAALALPAGAAQDLDAEAREIASGLRCPVCQNLSVADSPSEMAREMRALIVEQLRAGKKRGEIRAYFVSKYGEWILLSPTPRGFGLLVWVLPALGTLAGLGGAAWVVRRWARRGTSSCEPVDETVLARIREAVNTEDVPVSLSPEEARLVEALRELEFDHHAGKLSAEDYAELRTFYEARAAAALTAPRPQKRGTEVRVSTPAVPPRGKAHRVWRWAASALFLIAFGTAVGYFLPRALRMRGDGSITGDFLTGTWNQGVRVEPRDLPALLAQGQQAMEAQEFDRANSFFRRALEVDPDQPAAHAYLGLILLRAGHPDRALQSFDRALAREPTSPPALWGKGLVLYESMGKTADAIRTWEMLLAQEISQQDRDHVLSLLAEARERLAGQGKPVRRSTR